MGTVIKDAAIRAARTFFQAALPVYLLGLSNASALGELADSTLLSSAAIAGIIAALSFIMNVLEGASQASYNRG